MVAGGQVPGPRTESIRDRCLLSHMLLLTEKRAELPNWRRVNDSNTGPPSPEVRRPWPRMISAIVHSMFYAMFLVLTCEMEEVEKTLRQVKFREKRLLNLANIQ